MDLTYVRSGGERTGATTPSWIPPSARVWLVFCAMLLDDLSPSRTEGIHKRWQTESKDQQ
jgi:hypothetical protein